jgi:hypothetical protein
MKNAWLVIRALYELVRYEAIVKLRGSGCILPQLNARSAAGKAVSDDQEQVICEAVLMATCLYWKPVLCLQRAVCTARLLRNQGVPAHVAIGYRAKPFFSHAWVEVDGRVVYGSAAYQTRLMPLWGGL